MKTRTNRRLLHAALLAPLLGAAPAVHAGDFDWTGILGDDWDEIFIASDLSFNNWHSSAAGLPNANDTVLFGDTVAVAYVVDLNGDRSVLSAAFAGANAYTLNNDTLTLLTGNLTAGGTATHTINSNVALGADGVWDVDADLDFTGNLLGGTQTLELLGNGSIQLKGGANALDTLLLDGPSLTLSGTLTLAQDLRAVGTLASGLVTVTTGGDLMVGSKIDLDGRFDMRIESGGQVSAGSVGVANSTLEEGDLTVTGSDGAGNRSTLNVTGSLGMGSGNPSYTNLVISDGGLVTSGSGRVGGSLDNNSSAWAQVRGADGFGNHATWSIDNNLTVGGSDSLAEDALTIRDNGVVTVGNRVTIEDNGKVELKGGVFTANRIDLEGTFNFTGGKLTVDTFNGDLLQQGGTLAAGTSPGVTNINGNYELAGGALEFEFIDELNPGTSWDAYNVTGNVDLTGGSLQALQLAAFAPSADFEMIFMTIDGTRTGTFAGLAQDALVGNFTGTDLFITYQAGDGNDIALYSVPEPTSLALLGLGGLLVARRRRNA